VLVGRTVVVVVLVGVAVDVVVVVSGDAVLLVESELEPSPLSQALIASIARANATTLRAVAELNDHPRCSNGDGA
jgi:hypothetical protein